MSLSSINQGISNAFSIGKAVLNPDKAFYNLLSSDVDSNEPVGNTYRGFGSNWFNAGNIAREDFMRQEQLNESQFNRDLYMQELVQKFNSEEAKKQRDYDERMSNTQYQRAVEDMKKAGINPVLAVQHGASWSGGSSATSSPNRSNAGNYKGFADDSITSIASSLIGAAAGLLSKSILSKSLIIKG